MPIEVLETQKIESNITQKNKYPPNILDDGNNNNENENNKKKKKKNVNLKDDPLKEWNLEPIKYTSKDIKDPIIQNTTTQYPPNTQKSKVSLANDLFPGLAGD